MSEEAKEVQAFVVIAKDKIKDVKRLTSIVPSKPKEETFLEEYGCKLPAQDTKKKYMSFHISICNFVNAAYNNVSSMPEAFNYFGKIGGQCTSMKNYDRIQKKLHIKLDFSEGLTEAEARQISKKAYELTRSFSVLERYPRLLTDIQNLLEVTF